MFAVSARAWTEGTRCKWARTHAKAWAEWRRNVAKKISAAGAAAVVGYRASDVRPHPMAARFAQRIDALHGQAGQVLHRFTSQAAKPSQSPRALPRDGFGGALLAAKLLASVPAKYAKREYGVA